MNTYLRFTLSVLLLLSGFGSQAQLTLSSYSGQSEIKDATSVTLLPGFSIPAGSTVRIFVGASFQNPVPFTANPSANQNYVSIKIFKVAGVDESNINNPRNNYQVNQTIQYLDGLGRPIQSVTVQGSPGGNDIVQPVSYDAFGRESTKLLPYTAAGNNGTFRSDALSVQQGYYNSPPTGVAAITNSAFSETRFEQSPLNRVVEQGAPGVSWQLSAGHTQKMVYGINATDEVRVWTVSGNSALSAFYAAGTLYKTISKDENWKDTDGRAGTVEEFKDLDGRVVLKRIWETDAISLSTYYVYDDLGNLCYVLPPAVNTNGQSPLTSFDESQAVFRNFIYGYHYDGRKRLIEKQVPGKGWESMVYNKLDQLVLSQDARQRNVGKWTFQKYDGLGRMVSSGQYTDAAQRVDLQPAVNAETVLWETRAINADYTNVAFPRTGTDVHMVNYYDDYSFPGGSTYANPQPSVSTRGLATGSMVKVLGTTATMLMSVSYYDQDGRVIRTYKQHYLNGSQNAANYDQIDNTYNFAGELTASTRYHHNGTAVTSITTTYENDHMGRKLATKEYINGQAEIVLSKLAYNEIGQLLNKSVHSTDNGKSFLQNSTYSYNERGWNKGMTSDQFSYALKYADSDAELYRQYNGNIGYQLWGAGATLNNQFIYGYDKLNRLKSGIAPGMSEQLNYDVMGNITSLTRDGATGTYSYTDALGNPSNKLQRVTGGWSTGDYSYDVNGNAITDGNNGASLTYNILNLPATVNKAAGSGLPALAMTYVFAADGTKLKKTGGNDGTWNYVDGIEYDGSGIENIRTEEGTARRNGSSFIFEYNLTDHLGNVRYGFNKHPVTGAVQQLQASNYYPFGKRVEVSGGTNKYLYNGKELQAELKQYDYGARFYDPEIGRWNTIDPLSFKYPSATPYNYTFGNPIRFIDPDGRDTALYNRIGGQFIVSKPGGDKTAIFTVDGNSDGYDSDNPWALATALTYQVGSASGGISGRSFRNNHPLKNKGTQVGGQVFKEDLLDMSSEFTTLIEAGMSEFKNLNAVSNFGGLLSKRANAFMNLITDDAKYDLKSLNTNDGTASYSATVIGEWSMLQGALRRYDDYGNISYGIFGKAAGFSSRQLYQGSNINQLGKNVFGQTNGQGDEPRDVQMIQAGIVSYKFFLKK